MDFIIIQGLNGLASASSLFLVAAGLSLIFGVTRIVNFAHGSCYMLGAYLAVTLVPLLGAGTLLGFWGAVLIAALTVGALGAAMEVLLLRRIYHAPELFQLLATFGVVLIVQDAALWIWGPEDRLGPRAPGLGGFVIISGGRFPLYELFLMAVGPVVLGALWWLLHRTRWGILVRAATEDREMVGALGVEQRRLFTLVFALGSALAGLGGALQLPREAVNLHMDLAMIAEVFVVVVVGGLGSIPGAYLAAVLIGLVHAFGIVLFPKSTLVLAFLVMAVVLMLRPQGLLGRPLQGNGVRAPAAEHVLRPGGASARLVAALALAIAALLPVVAGDHAIAVATEIAILALFAASLQFMMGPGGMASFGHAAFFGWGAYAVALAVKWLALPMGLALPLAPLAAGLAGVLAGWFCVRLSGVYLAMLTLAFAQISWATAFQWVAFTGGDNGILGVWPPEPFHDRRLFYGLALVIVLAGLVLLRVILYAPFGYALRATRDSPLRAEAIGLPVRRVQGAAFTLAAAVAGLAGGLYAYAKGSVFPTTLAIPRSVEALVMVLLGGVQAAAGPLVGALVFKGLEEQLARATEFWRLFLGLVILALVILFPRGLVGGAIALVERRRAVP